MGTTKIHAVFSNFHYIFLNASNWFCSTKFAYKRKKKSYVRILFSCNAKIWRSSELQSNLSARKDHYITFVVFLEKSKLWIPLLTTQGHSLRNCTPQESVYINCPETSLCLPLFCFINTYVNYSISQYVIFWIIQRRHPKVYHL